jgi:competence protein ComEA
MTVTPQERLALAVVAVLLACGGASRALRPAPEPTGWSAADDAPRAARLRAATADSVRRAAHRARPLAHGERVDPSTAPADELQRLPRVGPALAERLVAWRASHGPFRTLADVDAVPGVGPALLAGIAPHLGLPAGTPARPAAPSASAPAPAVAPAVDLNRGTVAELETLPGVGPALAARIVAHRNAKGPFRTVDELDAVPGVGPALLSRVRGRVRASP